MESENTELFEDPALIRWGGVRCPVQHQHHQIYRYCGMIIMDGDIKDTHW